MQAALPALFAGALSLFACNDGNYQVGTLAITSASPLAPSPSGNVNTPSTPNDAGLGPGAPAVPPPPCPDVQAGTVAVYAFESADLGLDSTGKHSGSTQGPLAVTTGPEGCGQAILFEDNGFVAVEHAPEFNLQTGSVSLWLRLPAGDVANRSVLSRDEYNVMQPGHLLLQFATDNRLFVRLQRSMTDEVYACSPAPLLPEQWHHVGVNFGPPQLELWINGEQAQGEGGITAESISAVCGTGLDRGFGIDGNDNPWVFGADTSKSAESRLTETTGHLSGGALDHVIIRAERSDFAPMRLLFP